MAERSDGGHQSPVRGPERLTRRRFGLPSGWHAVEGRRARASRRFPLLPKRERFRRGIYLLPSLFTVANLFFGFYAIVHSIEGHFAEAALCIAAAILFDALDGKIARLTRTTSEFGLQLDSLCDVISFGVAPAVLCYAWALRGLGRAGWLVAFIYIVSGASRLARFNVQTAVLESKDFVGLPIPAGAAVNASFVLAFSDPPEHPLWPVLVLCVMGAVALLQVSTIRYPSFKRLDWSGRLHWRIIVAIAFLMALVAYHPPSVLLSLASVYMILGPAGRVFLHRDFKEKVAEVIQESPAPTEAVAGPGEPEARAAR